MNLSQKIFESDFILRNEHGHFHPDYSFDDFKFNEELNDYEYIGLKINKTAQESYKEWLYNEENPKEPELTDIEKVQQENKILKARIDALVAEGEFRDELIAEMAMIVYG